MSSKDRTYHIRSSKIKSPDIETILNKKLYIIVDEQHRPIHHSDGYMLFFHQKRKALRWIEKNASDNLKWRLEKLSVLITK